MFANTAMTPEKATLSMALTYKILTLALDTQVATLQGKGIMQVACGGSFSMALTDAGDVYTWGWGEQGQLGLGTTSMARYPEEVASLSGKGVSFIIACGSHAIAITRMGEMYAWGSAVKGQLGIKTSQSSFTTPTVVDAFVGKHIRNVACAGGIRAGHTVVSLEVRPLTWMSWGGGLV
jgi:alpha-tubulin suppressor-like RCC1 family protein